MIDLDDLFDSVIEKMDGFPEADYRLTTMQDYINEVSKSLEFAYAQKILRLKARINSELDDDEKFQLEGELHQLEDRGMEYLSHTIWGGILISVIATYESSVLELFSFFQQKHGKPKFKDNKDMKDKKSFIYSANQYSITNFNISLYRSGQDSFLLKDLYQLRNSYVHDGCNIERLPKELKTRVINKVYKTYSLGVKDGKWIANEANTKLYFQHVYESLSSYKRTLIGLL